MKFLTPARVTLLMLLVVGGLIAAYVAKNLWAGEEPVPAETRAVPMPVNAIPAGTLITENDLGLANIPIGDLPPDTFINKDKIVGRVAKVDLAGATPIRGSQLYRFGERPELPVAPGMRAITVSVGESDDVVDGHVEPGHFVDLHLTPSLTADPRLRGGTTLTVFRGIKVLAMNQGRTRTGVDRGGNTVTIELSPRQANIAIQAEKAGDLTLSLNPEGRGAVGVDVARDDRATLEEILDLPPLPEEKKPFQTRHFHGGGFGVLQFTDGTRDGGGAGISGGGGGGGNVGRQRLNPTFNNGNSLPGLNSGGGYYGASLDSDKTQADDRQANATR